MKREDIILMIIQVKSSWTWEVVIDKYFRVLPNKSHVYFESEKDATVSANGVICRLLTSTK